MPRKTFKSEPTGQTNLTIRQSPIAEGGTNMSQPAVTSYRKPFIVDDESDVTMADGFVDEGYSTNRENKQSGKSHGEMIMAHWSLITLQNASTSTMTVILVTVPLKDQKRRSAVLKYSTVG